MEYRFMALLEPTQYDCDRGKALMCIVICMLLE